MKKFISIRFSPSQLSENDQNTVEEELQTRFGVEEIRWTAVDTLQDIIIDAASDGIDKQEVYESVWRDGVFDGCDDDF